MKLARKSRTPRKHANGDTENYRKFLTTILKNLTIFFLILFLVVSGIVVGAVVGYIRSAEPITPSQLTLKGFTSSVYDKDGQKFASLASEKNREMVDSQFIPQNLKYAFVAIEDKRFYVHPGVDFIRFANAIFSFLMPGGDKPGGSTITQQLVKNITGDDQKSIKRKIQEQWRAIQLEQKLTKDQILETYLNIIGMGENCSGVQAASKLYFNKDVKNLTLAECASLAGITNLPGSYAPINEKNKQNNIKRQKIILKEMLGDDFIKQAEYDQAVNEKLNFADVNRPGAKMTSTQAYFTDQVVYDVKKGLMEKGYSEDVALKMIYNNGLKIFTTVDAKVQKAMDNVFLNKKNLGIINKTAGQPQAAMVILDSTNSQIRALYGGLGDKQGASLNRASSSLMQRQPGSTFKPIAVYGPAINEKIITPATVVDDAPVYMLGIGSGKYPQNYDNTYHGLTTIRDAIKNSINVVAAKTWMDLLGCDNSLAYLKKVNINRDSEKYVSIAMGGLHQGVNPLQMAAAYVPFVNKGLYYEPKTYTKVEDMDGKVLLETKAKSNIVYDEEAAFVMTSMLRDVPRYGTAYPYGLLQDGQMPTAGKTGTTGDNKDKWFVGFSPYYVGAVWYGYDQPRVLSSVEYSRALMTWHDVMEDVHKGLSPVQFAEPADIVRKKICIYSGKTAGPLCEKDPRGNSVREEIFIKGTEPKDNDICDAHKLVKVCKTDVDSFGRPRLATKSCPASTVLEKAFVQRKVPYLPISADDIYPSDWKYEKPSEYCRVHQVP